MRYILTALSLVIFTVNCTGQPSSVNKPHHTKNGFKNNEMHKRSKFFDFLKWRWQRLWKDSPNKVPVSFPLAKNDPAFLKTNSDRIALTWIGHATLLLQVNGKNILTDPIFSERASPIQWAGPKRVVPPGIAFKSLPTIDFVVISHDHYDSLDKKTIIKLHQREGGDKTVFLVPLGLKDWFIRLGIQKVLDLDWWNEHRQVGLNFIAVPVQHWSKRSIFSRNKTLWAGWVISSDEFRFFFSGDSGYASHFKKIGSAYGPFDVSAIPIGAYEPRWFMKNHHMNPEEALQAHLDLRSRKSVAIHWGTFMLTDEPLEEPPKRLAKALADRGLLKKDFVVLQHGETMILD